MATNCKSCKNAIFDPNWGEYKCSVLTIRVYGTEREDCIHYKRKSKKKEVLDENSKVYR